MDVRRIDRVGFAGLPVNVFAVPATIRVNVKNFVDIPAIEYRRFERPGMIVWIRVRLRVPEPMQYTPVVQMVFRKGSRHAFDANHRGPFGYAGNSRTR
jgi:hypothetical protein